MGKPEPAGEVVNIELLHCTTRERSRHFADIMRPVPHHLNDWKASGVKRSPLPVKENSEFPEHRVGFFKLLRAINLNCFPALLTIPPNQFKLFMDSIIWAIKHTMRDIAETGLNCEYIIPRFACLG